MTLSELLKLAKSLGLDLKTIERVAIEKGIPFARQQVQNHARSRMTAAIPKILKNLKDKAPLDGKQRRDKDGVLFDDWAFLCHESLYLLVKAVFRKVGLFIDGWRDAHLGGVLSEVSGADHSTPEAVVTATMEAELSRTF